MKMGDDGFRSAYNAQYATGGESQVVVVAEVVTVGSDQGQVGADDRADCQALRQVS